jgi:translation initiation factor IF-1
MEFVRECKCRRCGQMWAVRGAAANPSNETQFALEFPCDCGTVVVAHLPGSANRERLKVEPVPIGAKGELG